MAISEENTDIIHYLLKIIARYEGFMKTAQLNVYPSIIQNPRFPLAKNPDIHVWPCSVFRQY